MRNGCRSMAYETGVLQEGNCLLKKRLAPHEVVIKKEGK